MRQEVTIAEAADRWAVDRATVARIRVVAKEGALARRARLCTVWRSIPRSSRRRIA